MARLRTVGAGTLLGSVLVGGMAMGTPVPAWAQPGALLAVAV